MMDKVQEKCRLGIMRQSKVSLSGRVINIYIDGVKTTSIKNGGTTRLLLDPGRHIISLGIGSKITSRITLDLTPGSETNIMCYAKGSKAEAVLTSVDVCALASQTPSAQPQSNGSGCLIGLILFLIGMSILGVSIRFFVYLIPIG